MLAGVENVLAQIDAGDDVTICNVQTVDLSADYTPNAVGTNDYTLENIPINMDPQATGISIDNLPDDSYSDIIDIGFDFCFYSNVYDQLLISTNNYVTFDLTDANGYSSWITSEFDLLTPPGVVQMPSGPWMDLDPSDGGVYITTSMV